MKNHNKHQCQLETMIMHEFIIGLNPGSSSYYFHSKFYTVVIFVISFIKLQKYTHVTKSHLLNQIVYIKLVIT